MRKGGGHSKGSEFERKIAKDIVKAFKSFGVKQRECWRSVLSGGHAIACGDLEMSERLLQLFPYAIECKFYKKIRWENFLLNNWTSKEMKWLLQAKAGADKASKEGYSLQALLVMKANHTPIYVMNPSSRNILVPWTKFLKNAVEDANSMNGKPRESKSRVSSSRFGRLRPIPHVPDPSTL
jgi:hypothetical protein